MIEVNLLEPRMEPTAFPDRFLLRLSQRLNEQRARTHATFMVLIVTTVKTLPHRYSLKKVVKFYQEN